MLAGLRQKGFQNGKAMKIKRKKLSKDDKARQKALRESLLPSTANTIWYQALFETGLMQVKDNFFSLTYELGDVNYQTADENGKARTLSKYEQLLNSLDNRSYFQLTIHNKPIDQEAFRNSIFYPEAADGYDGFRQELNQMIAENMDRGENNFKVSKYITIGRREEGAKLAYRSLNSIGEYLKNGFKQINATLSPLSGEEKVLVMADMLRRQHPKTFSYDNLALSGLSTRDFIAPQLISFKQRNRIQVDSHYVQHLFVRDYETELGDRFLADLLNCGFELIINLMAHADAKNETLKALRTKQTLMESQKAGELQKNANKALYIDKASSKLEAALSEADELLATMRQTGDKLFDTVFLISVIADDEETLKERVELIKQIGGANDLLIEGMPYMQEQALNVMLPLGYPYLKGVSRKLLTSNIAVNSPWTSVDLQDVGGKYYGVNQISKNIITIDRKQLKTSSGLILGTSGSGKGMATKHEIISTVLKDLNDETDIIVVDPENEYRLIGEAFGATVIDIAPDTDTFVNIMDLPQTTADDSLIKIKSEFLLSWIARLLDRPLSGREKSLIDRSLRFTYRDFELPTLSDWLFVLGQQAEQEARDLTLDMELYVEGSLDIFSHTSNIQMDHNFLVYNLNRLGDELKPIALMAIFDQIWNRVVKNRALGRKTLLYFDEMQLLLLNQYASDFFFKLWSRVRKYGATPTGITQNVETLLLDPNGRRIIANSEFMILLQQSEHDLEHLAELLHLSDELINYLVYPDKGAGLIKAGGVVIPFSNTIDDRTQLFQLMSTDPKNMMEQ